MFFTLLAISFSIACFSSAAVAFSFRQPIRLILERIVTPVFAPAWERFIVFVLFVVGISRGVRIRELERFITTRWPDEGEPLILTSERAVLEIYRTLTSTLQGESYVLLSFFSTTLFAFLVIRVFELWKGSSADAVT